MPVTRAATSPLCYRRGVDRVARHVLNEHFAFVSTDPPYQAHARLAQAVWREGKDYPIGLHKERPLGSRLAQAAGRNLAGGVPQRTDQRSRPSRGAQGHSRSVEAVRSPENLQRPVVQPAALLQRLRRTRLRSVARESSRSRTVASPRHQRGPHRTRVVARSGERARKDGELAIASPRELRALCRATALDDDRLFGASSSPRRPYLPSNRPP